LPRASSHDILCLNIPSTNLVSLLDIDPEPLNVSICAAKSYELNHEVKPPKELLPAASGLINVVNKSFFTKYLLK